MFGGVEFDVAFGVCEGVGCYWSCVVSCADWLDWYG